jgi:hypothetical protein
MRHGVLIVAVAVGLAGCTTDQQLLYGSTNGLPVGIGADAAAYGPGPAALGTPGVVAGPATGPIMQIVPNGVYSSTAAPIAGAPVANAGGTAGNVVYSSTGPIPGVPGVPANVIGQPFVQPYVGELPGSVITGRVNNVCSYTYMGQSYRDVCP